MDKAGVANALIGLTYRGEAWASELASLSERIQFGNGSIPLDLSLELFEEEKGNVILDDEFACVASILSQAEVPEGWSKNPRLFCLLQRINRGNLLDQFLEASLTDLWLPLPQQTIRKFLKHDDEAKAFVALQMAWFNVPLPTSLEGQHLAVSEPDNLELDEVKLLGAGGYGEVHSVKSHQTGQTYAMKIMSRPVIHKRHVDLMNNFKREINGMRRTKHQHCVTLEVSLTDRDSVRLLYSPVADMDLSVLLDSDSILEPDHETLWTAIGCITSALAYLHDLNIRHDDLKPNNILIHGEKILLTDFGFCLDTTDSGISTTTGPPAHYSRRYSAPEVTSHAPRSRLTDIWSLGCVLFEIVSRLSGHKLSTMNNFWLEHGIRYNSYAENQAATRIWYESILAGNSDFESRELRMTSFIYNIVLEPERLLRPTASSILNKWKDLDFHNPGHPSRTVIRSCCFKQTPYLPAPLHPSRIDPHRPLDPWLPFMVDSPCWPLMDILCYNKHLAYIFLGLGIQHPKFVAKPSLIYAIQIM